MFLMHSDLTSGRVNQCTLSSLAITSQIHVPCVTLQHNSARGVGDAADAQSSALTCRAHTWQVCRNGRILGLNKGEGSCEDAPKKGFEETPNASCANTGHHASGGAEGRLRLLAGGGKT